MQIPRVDCTKTFLPVASKTAIYVLIRVELFFGLPVEMFNVEAAFLNAKCKNKTFIKCPEAAKEISITNAELMQEYCIMLNNAMYGTVDAALLKAIGLR